MSQDRHQQRVGRVEHEDAQDKIERLQQQQRDHAAATESRAKPKPPAEPAAEPKTAGQRDQFREPTRLEKFAHRLLQKVGRDSPQEFRLPSGRMLHDRRGQPAATTAAASSEGRIVSAFEEEMIKRFEQGANKATSDPDAPIRFLKKTAAQWSAFFKSFMARTVKKQVAVSDLADTQTFRGLLKHASNDGRGTMIGDLALRNGQVEKFTRMQVSLDQAAQLRGLDAGSQLSRQQVADLQQGDSLQYFAIGPRGAEEQVFEPRATSGIFTNLRTEEAVAERLGLAREGSRSGMADKLRERDAVLERNERFVPWWSWDRERRGGARRWFVPVTLVAVSAAVTIGFWLLLQSL